MGKILITGAAGFIGKHLVRKLMDGGQPIIAVDSISNQIHPEGAETRFIEEFGKSVVLHRIDMRSIQSYDKILEGVSTVIHLAAETGTGQSMYMQSHYYEVNVMTTVRLLESICKNKRKDMHFIFASSRAVYGEGAYQMGSMVYYPPPRSEEDLRSGKWELEGPKGEKLRLIPTPETAATQPASIYGASKLAIEDICRILSNSYKLKCTCLRFQNVYGIGQSLKNPYTGILNIFTNKLRAHAEVNIYEDGKESRDFVYVSDVAESIRLTINRDGGLYEIINIGSGQAYTLYDIASRLKIALQSRSKIIISGDYRLGDIRHCYADIKKSINLLGYSPTITLEDGLSQYVEWVEKSPLSNDLSQNAASELRSHGLGG